MAVSGDLISLISFGSGHRRGRRWLASTPGPRFAARSCAPYGRLHPALLPQVARLSAPFPFPTNIPLRPEPSIRDA